MSEHLRDRLREEMSGQQRPPVADLVSRAIDGAVKTRQVRRAASGFGTVTVVGITVLAVTAGGQLSPARSGSVTGQLGSGGVTGADISAATAPIAGVKRVNAPVPKSPTAVGTTALASAPSVQPSTAVSTVLDPETVQLIAWSHARKALTAAHPPTWTSPPAGVPATTGGVLQLLSNQLAAYGKVSHDGVTADNPFHVQLYLTRDGVTSMVRATLYQDTTGYEADCLAPPASLQAQGIAAPSCSKDANGDYVVVTKLGDDESVQVVHPDGSGVSIDLFSWLAWDGTGNKQAPRALTLSEATALAADPQWDLSMDPALVSAGAVDFPHPPTFG